MALTIVTECVYCACECGGVWVSFRNAKKCRDKLSSLEKEMESLRKKMGSVQEELQSLENEAREALQHREEVVVSEAVCTLWCWAAEGVTA